MLLRNITIGLLLGFAFLCITSCDGTPETSEQFVARVIDYVKTENQQALFEDCYISSKSDIKKMLIEMGGSSAADNKRVSQMHKASQEDKNRVLRKFSRLGLKEATSITVDSINTRSEKKKGMGGDIDFSDGYRAAKIEAFITVDEQQHKMELTAIDLDSGKFKLVRHPQIYVVTN